MAELRRCIGSERYVIEPHEAPVEEFPKQPSQKDGLGRMCKPHWNQYTAGLARDRKARLANDAKSEEAKAPAASKPRKPTNATKASEPVKGESPTATARRQSFEKRLAKVGAGSEEGQRMLERAAKEQRGNGREKVQMPEVEEATTS